MADQENCDWVSLARVKNRKKISWALNLATDSYLYGLKNWNSSNSAGALLRLALNTMTESWCYDLDLLIVVRLGETLTYAVFEIVGQSSSGISTFTYKTTISVATNITASICSFFAFIHIWEIIRHIIDTQSTKLYKIIQNNQKCISKTCLIYHISETRLKL